MQNGPKGVTMPTRTIEEITASVFANARSAAMSLLAMGQDLIDAKAQLGHGRWLPWLRSVGINPRTAENYMRVADEVEPGSRIAALPITKALAVLDIPAESREQFLAEHDPDEMSAAEIRRLTKLLDEEKQRTRQAQDVARDAISRANTSVAQAAAETRRAEKAEARAADLAEELRQTPERVVERTVEVPPADYTLLQQRLKEAEDAAEEAEARAAAAVSESQTRAAGAMDGSCAGLDVFGFELRADDLLREIGVMACMGAELAALPTERRARIAQAAARLADAAHRLSEAAGRAAEVIRCE